MRTVDYWMRHRPDEDGATLDNAEQMFPDVLTHPEWYDYDSPGEDVYGFSLRAIRRCAGNPDAPVWIWRAMPEDAGGIRPGDWVTTSKAYARLHMEGEDGWKVAARRVRARDIRTEGNSVCEWGYFPVE